MQTTDNLVEIRDLAITFAHSVEVVNGLALDIPAGKTLCLVGESGCGKSVTAKAILQVIDHPGRVSGGSIKLRQADGSLLETARPCRYRAGAGPRGLEGTPNHRLACIRADALQLRTVAGQPDLVSA